jgi:thymidylate synthase
MKSNLEPVYITANTIPEAWAICLRWIINSDPDKPQSCTHKYKIDSGSYAGQYRWELDYITGHILYPGSLPMVPDVPPGIPNPSSDEYVTRYILKLMTSMKDKNEEYTYGEYLESQIPKIIEKYKSGPGNNQCIMTVGGRESIDQKDPPCLRFIDTRVLDGKLHFFVYFRSWDLWAGFPNNLAALQHLKKYMADEMGLQDGDLMFASKGLHLYSYAWDLARQVVNR